MKGPASIMSSTRLERSASSSSRFLGMEIVNRPLRSLSPNVPFGRVNRHSSSALVRRDVMRYFRVRSEEHTSELQSLMRISSAVFCLQQQRNTHNSTALQSESTPIHQQLV